ncbi:hypothetical protein KCU99_g4077, partial [Aureobasidium melanogenum]
MPAPKIDAPSELPVSTIVDWFGRQEHFPPVIETDNRLKTKVGEALRTLFSDNDDEAMDVELSQPFPLKVVTSASLTNTSA